MIDLGPEGGSGGGKILFSGTPEGLCKVKDSFYRAVFEEGNEGEVTTCTIFCTCGCYYLSLFKISIMQIATYTAFRQQLKSYLDRVRNSHTPLYVTSANGEDVVVLSKSDYESMEETFYLLKSPNNASRLLKSIEDYDKGLGQERRLIEE